MTERQTYLNAPIVLMAFEVRHPTTEQLNSRQIAQFSTRVRDRLPLPGEVSTASISFQLASNGESSKAPVVRQAPRWTSRDKRTALTVNQDALVLETTRYTNYNEIRELLQVALQARAEIAAPAGVERVGLRYIDEIRVPAEDGDSSPAWREWLDESLLGPARVADTLGLVPAQHQGLAVFSTRSDQALVLRYGVQTDYAVASTPQLRRPLPPPGPLFKLDIDSFWQAGETVPEFSVDTVLRLSDELHAPVRGVFESVITDRLREEVLRRG